MTSMTESHTFQPAIRSSCKLNINGSLQKLQKLSCSSASRAVIHNIGGSDIADSTRERLFTEIRQAKMSGHRVVLPDELLYNDVGLQIWSDIIHLPQYYQFRDETEILRIHGSEIASYLPNHAVLIDLGAGDTTKVSCLISALTAAEKRTTYLALDLSEKYLRLNCERLTWEHPNVDCHGLWGTFSDGMQELRKLPSPRVFLSLGSVLCNDEWNTALRHLRSWSAMLREEDFILIGMDGHTDSCDYDKIWRSYHPEAALSETDSCAETGCSGSAKCHADNDSGIEIDVGHSQLYEAFWRNGFEHANHLVGEDWFRFEDWTVRGFLEEVPTLSHRFIFQANRDIALGSSSITFKQGEEFDWFDAHKYGPADVTRMCGIAGLEVVADWQAPDSHMRSYLVRLAR